MCYHVHVYLEVVGVFVQKCTGSRPAAVHSLSLGVLPSSQCRLASALIDDMKASWADEKSKDMVDDQCSCMFIHIKREKEKKRVHFFTF